MKSSSSSPFSPARAKSACSTATEFLRNDGKMAAIMPMAARLVTLQQDCAKALPQHFEACSVLKLEEGTLTLAAPNAAVAARLKQKLPGLQERLVQSGWKIDAMRVKVQMKAAQPEAPAPGQKSLPPKALSSLDELHKQISLSGNRELAEALGNMIAHHKGRK